MAHTESAMVAKKIREALKVAFPDTKFSVRKVTTGAIVVSWVNFPTVEVVEIITDQFKRVDRCEITGEILAGGNLFVRCQNEWTQEVREQIESKVPDCFDKNDYNYYHWFEKTAQKMYDEMTAKVEAVKTVETVEETQVDAIVEIEEQVSITEMVAEQANATEQVKYPSNVIPFEKPKKKGVSSMFKKSILTVLAFMFIFIAGMSKTQADTEYRVANERIDIVMYDMQTHTYNAYCHDPQDNSVWELKIETRDYDQQEIDNLQQTYDGLGTYITYDTNGGSSNFEDWTVTDWSVIVN